MAEADRIARGSRVRLHYSIALEDGTVADSSFGEEPLALVLGDGTLQHGLEQALLGLAAGERRSFQLDPWHAFGYRDPDAVHVMPRAEFPPDMDLTPGNVVGFTTPAGDELAGIVKAVEGEAVTIDFSHPLAGHEITFTVEILAVEPPRKAGD